MRNHLRGLALSAAAMAMAAMSLAFVPAAPVGAAAPPAPSQRAAVEREAAGLEAILRHGAPATFGGLWVAADGVVHVTVTRIGDPFINGALSAFPWRNNTVVSVVSYSDAHLRGLVARITADLPALAAAGAAITLVYPDPRTDSVVVGLTPATMRYGSEVVRGRYMGEPIQTAGHDYQRPTLGVCTRNNCVPDLQGGLEVDDVLNFLCTSGAIVNKNGGGLVLLTAGHCFSNGENVTQGSVLIGKVTFQQFSGDTDAEVVSITNPAWMPQPCAFTNSDCGQHVTGGSSPVVGGTDCKSGDTSGYSCGSVIALNVTVQVNDNGNMITLTNQAEANVCTLPGDSGGPHLDGVLGVEGFSSTSNFNVVNGQNVCNSSPNTTFTPISTVFARTGTNLATTP